MTSGVPFTSNLQNTSHPDQVQQPEQQQEQETCAALAPPATDPNGSTKAHSTFVELPSSRMTYTGTNASIEPMDPTRETLAVDAGTGGGSSSSSSSALGGTLVSTDQHILPTRSFNDSLDDTSLTAALVAALVQTRDGPFPPSNHLPPTPIVPPNHTQQEDLQVDSDSNSVHDQVGNGVQEEPQHESVQLEGTRTRSGRRTRPTPAAMSSYSNSSGTLASTQAHTSGTTFDSISSSRSNLGPASGRKKGSRVRWTPAEDERLVELIKEEPPLTWTQMGERLGRPGAGCAMRWYNFIRQQVGEAEAETLSNKMRGKAGGGHVAPHGTSGSTLDELEQELQVEDNPNETEQGANEPPDSAHSVPEVTAVGAQAPSTNGPMRPSQQMQVGPSRIRTVDSVQPLPINQGHPQLPTPPAIASDGLYAGGYPLTGQVVNLGTIPLEQLPPRLPPDPSKPGHPFPRTGAIHSNSGPNYLPDQALVKDPPIPFVKNTIIRGRRTHDATTLQAVIDDAPVGKQKKVHPCPADNCGAAFKRSEHLKRHYKSVHRGEKPFPCKIENCGKSFSRKDNLQQHQAMVHGVRAVYTYSDGTVSVNPPDGDEDPVDIAYEEVDITKTARGAARQARQQARAKKTETKKTTTGGMASRKRRVKREADLDLSEDEDERDEEEGDDDDDDLESDKHERLRHENGNYPPPHRIGVRPTVHPVGPVQGLHQPRQLSPPASHTRIATHPVPSRGTSNVQGLMSQSSVGHSFPIGPNSNGSSRTHGYGIGSNGHGHHEVRRSASSESNERGAISDVRHPVLGDKRPREANGTGDHGGVDKRLRLVGDVQAHELDPALRVLADATAAVSSGRNSPFGTVPSPVPTIASSIAPNSSSSVQPGLSPLIQHALKQHQQQQSTSAPSSSSIRPSTQPHTEQQDIPVSATAPYALPASATVTSRPFVTASTKQAISNQANSVATGYQRNA
ncbi:uncharacterized protein JCM15063_006402 [Sporobolomyces koalae]|uniref:uncharacterized protein n=1 Tax=Sporobolomyces koalae TaxID=500713 RepID=UPI0031734618